MDREPQLDPLKSTVTPISRAPSARAHGFTDTPALHRTEALMSDSLPEALNSGFQILLESDLPKDVVMKIMDLTLIDIEEVREEGMLGSSEPSAHITEILILKNILRFTSIEEVESTQAGDISQSTSALNVFLHNYPVFLNYLENTQGRMIQIYTEKNSLLSYLQQQYTKARQAMTLDAIDALISQITMLVCALDIHNLHELDAAYWRDMQTKYHKELKYIDKYK